MNYEALINKLKEPKFATLDNQQAADAINAEKVKTKRLVPVVEVKQWAIENQLYAPIVVGRQSSDDKLKHLCISIVGWIDDIGGRVQNADFDKPAAQAMMEGLVYFGVATQQQIDDLKTLQWEDVSWCEVNGWSGLEVGHIESARQQMEVQS